MLDADAGSAPIPGLDLPAVLAWVDGRLPGLLGPGTTPQLIAGGRSNLTYLLTDGDTRLVLRRPPLGHVLATAHDMGREYRLISALAPTAVPVPDPVAICPDDGVTGAPFYLMSYAEGRIIRDAEQAADLSEEQRAALSRAMVGVLADLHAVDPAEVGLADLGKPEGFLARQVKRWGIQLDHSHSRDLEGMPELREGLAATVPAGGRSSIVHGDYRLDNLVVAGPDEPDALSVRAVLDWEMATLGDPLADLGLLLAYWDVLGELDNEVSRAMGARAGFPSGETLVQWYAERGGADVSGLPWYVALGLFKLAVILEGIHYRYTQGKTVGGGFDQIGTLVTPLLEHGLAAISREQ
jgi:aminoglycoside phosphotransferase (APT) family kinase protein